MGDITDLLVEIQILQQASQAGNLVIVTGNTTSTGTVVSYTPPNERTFVLYRAKTSISGLAQGINLADVNLKNNTTIVDTINLIGILAAGFSGAIGNMYTPPTEFIIRGDTLLGDGTKTYQINVGAINGTPKITGTIIGYLL